MRKVILGVDIDGTVGDYIQILREYLADRFNIPAEQLDARLPAPKDYEFTDWGKDISSNFKQLHSEAVAEGLYEKMDAFPNARDKLWLLNSENYHIRIITSRFVMHGQNYQVVSSTGKWLDNHDIPYRDLMFVHEKTDVFVDVLIDDSPYNIESYQQSGRDVIIFDAPYNQHLDGIRVKNWTEAYNAVKKLYPDGMTDKP